MVLKRRIRAIIYIMFHLFYIFYRKFNKDHSLIKAFLKKSRRRVGVITEVLETCDQMVIEFTSKCGGKADASVEVCTRSFKMAIHVIVKGSLKND